MSAIPRMPPTAPPTMAPVSSWRAGAFGVEATVEEGADEEVIVGELVVDNAVVEVDNVKEGGTAPNATPRASETLSPPPDHALGSTRAYSGIIVSEGTGILGGKLIGGSVMPYTFRETSLTY